MEGSLKTITGPGDDPYRLHYHLMPPQGWMNDPNGLCRYREEYHVFFQYSPDDVDGGNKCWGHYISRDLLRWEFLGTALSPDSAYDKDGAYSGSALAEGGGLYLFYTGNVKEEGEHDYIHSGRQANTLMAFSRDGRSFEGKRLLMDNRDYPPRYTCHVRDPKVWKQGGQYYMLQGGRIAGESGRRQDDRGAAILFVSEDLLRWKVLREITTEEAFGYMWECPDYFRLDGQGILSVSPQGLEAEEWRYQNIYQSGWFLMDERPEDTASQARLHDFREWDMGFDFYAPQTFEDGDRRLLIGWAGMPDAPYDNKPETACGRQHALTVPRELRLRGGRVLQNPAGELEALRRDRTDCGGDVMTYPVRGRKAFELWLEEIHSAQFEWRLFPAGGRGGLHLSWSGGVFRMAFTGEDAGKIGRGRGERNFRLPELNNVRILVDASLAEVYLNDGEYVMTTRFYLPEEEWWMEVSCPRCRKTVWELAGMEVIM